MTPEKAKGLLGIASPGPWRADRYVYMNGQSVYDKNGYKLAQGMSGNDADLIAAAPELAEIVAGLRYEYAVQVIEDGHTWYINSYKTLTSGSRSAAWLPTFESADTLRRQCVTELCLQERRAETFVVRRLTTELEVIDPEVVKWDG